MFQGAFFRVALEKAAPYYPARFRHTGRFQDGKWERRASVGGARVASRVHRNDANKNNGKRLPNSLGAIKAEMSA